MFEWLLRRKRGQRYAALAREAIALRDRSPEAARRPLGQWASLVPGSEALNSPTMALPVVRPARNRWPVRFRDTTNRATVADVPLVRPYLNRVHRLPD